MGQGIGPEVTATSQPPSTRSGLETVTGRRSLRGAAGSIRNGISLPAGESTWRSAAPGRQVLEGREVERHPHPSRGRHLDLPGVVEPFDERPAGTHVAENDSNRVPEIAAGRLMETSGILEKGRSADAPTAGAVYQTGEMGPPKER